mmetsp:Transcript_107745/g.303557  ORF Transcript_107745/g.303557 Transcript_107745/m.303557 type:complete len:225 (+) Transcript_107745:394-1068(+)
MASAPVDLRAPIMATRSPRTTGTRNTCPIDTRAALRLKGSPQSSERRMACTPKAAPTLKSEPTASSSRLLTASTRRGTVQSPNPGTTAFVARSAAQESTSRARTTPNPLDGLRAAANTALACLAGIPVMCSIVAISHMSTWTAASPRRTARASMLARIVSNSDGFRRSRSTTKSLWRSRRIPSGPSAITALGRAVAQAVTLRSRKSSKSGSSTSRILKPPKPSL